VLIYCLELYTDESPGLKVDPFVVMVLSIGFIISVVALHSMMAPIIGLWTAQLTLHSHRESDEAVLVVILRV
jgi:hypothetical protein